MSQSQEQSYYEIALTNRQVLSIFVVLLVCILAAFLGGVWLARGAEARVEMAEAQSITAGALTEAAPLEQLDFFDRRDDAQPLREASAQPEPAQPEPKQPEPTQPEAQKPAPSQSAPVAKVENPPADRRPQPKAPAAKAATPPPTEAPEPKPTVPANPAAVPEYLVVQVFSSTDQAQASRVVEQLRKGGYPAVLSPVEVDNRTLYRVRIGPYTDRDEAQVVADAVSRSFKLDTWITH